MENSEKKSKSTNKSQANSQEEKKTEPMKSELKQITRKQSNDLNEKKIMRKFSNNEPLNHRKISTELIEIEEMKKSSKDPVPKMLQDLKKSNSSYPKVSNSENNSEFKIK